MSPGTGPGLLAGPVLHPRRCRGALGLDGASCSSCLAPCRGLAALTGERHHPGGIGADWWLAWVGGRGLCWVGFLRVGEKSWAAWVNPS